MLAPLNTLGVCADSPGTRRIPCNSGKLSPFLPDNCWSRPPSRDQIYKLGPCQERKKSKTSPPPTDLLMRERFLPLPGKWPPPCTRQSKHLALHRWALQTRGGWVWGQSEDYSSRGHGDPAYPSMGYQASTRTSLVLGAEDQQKKSNMYTCDLETSLAGELPSFVMRRFADFFQ